MRAAVRSRAGCETRPQSLRTVAAERIREARGRSRTDVGRLCRPSPCRLATRAGVSVWIARAEDSPSTRRAGDLPLERSGHWARVKREKGVEPSMRVWKTRLLPVTSLPRIGRAVQDLNPQPRRPKRRALIPFELTARVCVKVNGGI